MSRVLDRRPPTAERPARGPARHRLLAGPWLALALLAAALIAFPYVLTEPFWQNAGVLAMTFAIAAAGWNVLGGFTGQISFGHAIFFGAGAYATAVLVRDGWSPWPTFVVGAVIAAIIAVAIGFPVFRLRGHYFAIATIAAGEIALAIVVNLGALGAARGLTLPLRDASLWNLQFSIRDKTPYYLVALGLFAAASLLLWAVLRGRFGSYLRAIRDDQDAAAAAGIPVRRYKLQAYALSAALTAVAGGFYAMYVLFVNPPSTMALTISITIALMVVLGGAGSLWAPLIGAWGVTLLTEYTRTHYSGEGRATDLMFFGAAIVAVAVFEPGGIAALPRRLRRRRS